MIRTRPLVLALLVPLLVTGCVAVAPTAGRPTGDLPPGAAGRPAEERTAPSRGQADLVESGRRTSGTGEKDEKGEKDDEDGKGGKAGKDGKRRDHGAAGAQDEAVRESGRGRAAGLRSQGEGRAVGARPPAAGRQATGAPRSVSRPPRTRRKAPTARVRPSRPRQPRGHRARQRPGFRMGEWCRQARGVASSDVVSLCHSAYGR
ncbi:hypothetical protein [Streptomyces sp. NPDC002640]